MASSPEEAVRHFWQRDGEEYDLVAGHDISSDEEQDLWAGLLSGIPPGSAVLDVGTGTGYAALLAARHGHRVSAVDWSDSMMSTAKKKASSAALTIAFHVARAESLPFRDDSFDAVTARHVLWTLLDPLRALKDWHRALTPGGVLFADFTPGGTGGHYPEQVSRALPLGEVEDEGPVLDLLASAGFSSVGHQLLTHHDPHRRRVLIRAIK